MVIDMIVGMDVGVGGALASCGLLNNTFMGLWTLLTTLIFAACKIISCSPKKYEIDKSMFVMKLQMTCRLNDEMNVLI